jgi:hypothetical protein
MILISRMASCWYDPYASHRHISMYSDTSDVFLMLSDVYAQISATHETSKMCTYTSQAIATSPSTYTLKSQQFPLICNDPLRLYVSHELLTSSMSLTFLSIPMHQGLEISVCPPCNRPFCVPCYLIYPILIPDYYLRSVPSHCLAHCLSVVRYSSCIWFFIAYARFPSSWYISISLVVIPWPIVSVLPII